MTSTQATLRVDLELQTDHLSKIVTAQLHKFDAQAAAIRAEDADKKAKRHPPDVMAEEVGIFKNAVAKSRTDILNGIAFETDKAKAEFELQRDRKPEIELVAIRRAESWAKGQSDEQIKETATNYVNDDAATISVPELNEARARLRSSGADMELELMNDAAESRFAEKPWIANSEDLRELTAYGADLRALKNDEVMILDKNSNAKFAQSAADLIDWNNELSAE